MPYLVRRGIIANPIIILFSWTVAVLLMIKTDWGNQILPIRDLGIAFTIINDDMTILGFYFLLSAVLVIYWWTSGKYLSPSLGLFITRLLAPGSVAFLDFKLRQQKVSWIKFIIRYLNLGVSLFAIDFLLVNTIFSSYDIPNIYAFFIALIVISVIQPLNWTLEDIGLRSYKEASNEIVSVTSFLDRFLLKFLQISTLIGSFAYISLGTETDIIDAIPVNIRIVFVRAFFVALLTLFLYTMFFQVKPDNPTWKKRRNVLVGKIKVNF